MTRERDSQRSKLYTAEHTIPRGLELREMDAIIGYLERVMAHQWYRRHYGAIDRYELQDGRGRSSAAGGLAWRSTARMTFPTWSRCERILLHELAHAITRKLHGFECAAHGWQFAAVFLDLVRHFMGAEVGEQLRLAFRENRVRYAAPRKGRPMTPEQRSQAVERLAAARRPARTDGAH
jgi:putative metallohydrolase (TIGR04338 family)